MIVARISAVCIYKNDDEQTVSFQNKFKEYSKFKEYNNFIEYTDRFVCKPNLISEGFFNELPYLVVDTVDDAIKKFKEILQQKFIIAPYEKFCTFTVAWAYVKDNMFDGGYALHNPNKCYNVKICNLI